MYDLYGTGIYGGSGLAGWPYGGPLGGAYPTVEGKEPEKVKEPKAGLVTQPAVANLRTQPLAMVGFGGSWMLWGGGEKFVQPPRFSYLTDCLMDRDPTLVRCQAHYEGRIKSSLWTYTKRKDDVPDEWVEAVRETFDALRPKLISEALRCLSNGHRLFEKVWERDDGKLTLADCIGYEPVGLQILKYKDSGAYAGFTAGTIDQRLPPNKSFVVRVNGHGGNLHGRSYHQAAYDPWCDKNRARWDRIGIARKLSGVIPMIQYPQGSAMLDGVEVDNAVVGQRMLAALGLGNGAVMPAVPMEISSLGAEEMSKIGNTPWWKLDFYDAGNLAPATMGIIGAMEYDDKLLCRAWRVSERAIIEATTSGSRADSESHQDDDTLQLEHIDDLIAEQVTEGAVDDYLEFNFGREARGTIRIEPAPLHAEKKINARAIVSMMLGDQAFGPRLAQIIDIDQVVEDAGYKVTETKWADTEPPPVDPMTGLPMDAGGMGAPAPDDDGWEPQPEDDEYVPMNGNGNGNGNMRLSRLGLVLSGCGTGAEGFERGNKCQKPGQGGGLVKGKAIQPAPRTGAPKPLAPGQAEAIRGHLENTQRQQRIAQQHAGEKPHEKWRRRSESHVANIHAADGAVDNAPTTGGIAGLSDKVEDYAEDTGGELVDAHRDNTDHKIGLRTGKGHDERFEAVHLNGDVYAWRDGASGAEGIGSTADMSAAYNTAREEGAIPLSAHLAGKTTEHEEKHAERQTAKAGRTPVSGSGISASRMGGRFADVLRGIDWLGRMTGDDPGLMLGGNGDDCDWKTIHGAHVCIRDGKVVKGPAHLVGKTEGETAEHEGSSKTSTRPGFYAAHKDEKGRHAHSDPDVDVRVKSLKLPPAWTDVHVSEDPASKLQAVGKDAKGRPQYRYSTEHSGEASAVKFSRVKQFVGKLPEIRAKLADDSSEESAVLRLVDQTGLRVGSDTDTKAEKQAYGATTLRREHVQVEGGKTFLAFTGKKGVDIRQEIADPAIAGELRARAALTKTGKLFDTTDAKTRDALHAIAPGYKVKDFRTVVAADTAYQAMKQIPTPKDAKSYTAAVVAVATNVSGKLGNTPTIALQSYIPPEVFSAWRSKVANFEQAELIAQYAAQQGMTPDKAAAEWIPRYAKQFRTDVTARLSGKGKSKAPDAGQYGIERPAGKRQLRSGAATVA